MRRVGLTLCLMLLSSVMTGSPRADLRHEIYEMPIEVSWVKNLGYWRSDDKEGYFRVIISEHETRYQWNMLWIQWICNCADGRISMVSIREISENEPFRYVSEPVFAVKQGRALINLDVVNSRTREQKQVQVQIQDFGNYQFVMRNRPDPVEGSSE
jgi:hypothetical protein